MISLKSLEVRKDVVTCWKLAEAPPELQELNLTGKAKFIWVVPTKLADHIEINSIISEPIRGGVVFVS
jgi:hypothetical protein